VSFTYQVTIRGRLSPTLAGEFEQLGLLVDVDPVATQLHGSVEDQAALYGLIRRIEALGLDLVELRRCRHEPPVRAAPAPARAAPRPGGSPRPASGTQP
jgi:hypothetical protein